MTTPILQTDRLLLRPFTQADAADVFVYASNPNVSRYCTWQTHRTIADAEAFIEMVLNRPATEYTWAIRLLHDATVIGAIEFGLSSGTEAQFHYVLSEPFWNRGLMTEAGQAVVRWGMDAHPKIRRLFTSAMSQNIGSQRVMEKCGLQLERVIVEKWDKYPEPIQLRQYALIRSGD
jgi:ribosomal-protein-alanine N-acetyltransferase